MSSKNWIPVQGNEVQVRFPDNYWEIAKFVQDNQDGTCDVKVGKRRYTVFCRDVYENKISYKRNKKSIEKKFETSDMYEEEKYYYN